VSYELLFGKRPYRGKTNSALTQAILSDELKFPADAESKVSPECMSCLRGLICRDIDQRLGCGTDGFERLKSHPWFKGLDWQLLGSKGVEPPFTPDTKHANFDATHELEELLLEDNPLKVKKRAKTKPGQEPPTLSKEQRQMEERFTVYDWSKAALAKKRKESMMRRERLKQQETSELGTDSYADLGGFERDDALTEVDEKQSQSVVRGEEEVDVREEGSGNPYQRKEMGLPKEEGSL
jgi:serine/threonine protein kinase